LGQGAGDGAPVSPVSSAQAFAAFAESLRRLPDAGAAPAAPAGGLVSGSGARKATAAKPVDLHDLADDQLSDLLASIIEKETAEAAQRTKLVLAADEAARDPATRAALAKVPAGDEQVKLLLDRLK